MNSHKLTTADSWFIEKGQIDSQTRERFDIGHEVVVCENHHVMLLDFYNGECPTCKSKVTVPFNRSNVERKNINLHYNKPKSANTVNPPRIVNPPRTTHTVTDRRRIFGFQRFRRYIINSKYVFMWILGLLICCGIVLNLTGIISNERFFECVQVSILPKTKLMLFGLRNFLASDEVNQSFINANSIIIAKSGILLANMLAIFLVLVKGTKDLIYLIFIRTKILIGLITEWISGFVKHIA